MSISPKLRLSGLSLCGLILLLLAALAAVFSLVNLRQIEQARAESLQKAFESHFDQPDLELAFLDNLKTIYQANWQVFLRSTASTNGSETGNPVEASIPNTDLKLKASTLAEPVYESVQAYSDVLSGEARLSQMQLLEANGSLNTSVYSFPVHDETGSIIGVGEVFWDRTSDVAAQRNMLLLSLATFVAILLIGAVGLTRIYRQVLSPYHSLAEYSDHIRQGEYSLETPVVGEGTQAVLATNLKEIASQMGVITGNLDTLVAERTSELECRNRQVQTAAEIASQIAAPHHLDDLLVTAVNLIREGFDYYHVGIFLVDDQKRYAVLKAANGETGKLLVQSGHKLGVGQSGIVGMVTAKGEPRIAADVSLDAAHYRNPILPYTRAEMALPLKAGGDVIGALDVQSMESGAFTQEDVSLLQTLADQLAVAIENTRLVEKLEASIEETNRLNKSQIEGTWRHYTEQTQITGYQYDRMQVLPAETSIPEDLQRQLRSGRVYIQNAGDQSVTGGSQRQKSTLLVPLILREQLIGVIGIEKDQPNHNWSENELAIAQAAANQVSLTLENARLLEETHQRAERERIAGQISARLRVSNDPQQILQTAVSELKQALRAQKAQVMIAPHTAKLDEVTQPTNERDLTGENGGNGHGI